MKPQPETEGTRWFREAENDLAAARHLQQGGFCSLACFHAQQAAGKAVKAFLYAQGAEDVRGHSVADLLQDAVTFSAELEGVYAVGAALDKFYIPTRYPNGLPGGLPMEAFLPEEALQAMTKAEAVLSAVRRLLPKASARPNPEHPDQPVLKVK